MKILIRALVACASVVTGLAVLTPPAHAADDPVHYHRQTRAYAGYVAGAGEAIFQPYGEWLVITDWASDGAGVRVYYSYNGGAWQTKTDTKGYDAGSMEVNLDYPEGRAFTFYVCLEDEGLTIPQTCGATIKVLT
jgi:hypothetical protein